MDRHACVNVDVNLDGLPDIQCFAGAGAGKGHGFNELYITQEDGSLIKVLGGGGLQKYTTLRTRQAVTLNDPNGDKLIFVGVKGKPRDDGEPNTHRMFKHVWKLGDDVNGVYFEEVEGPWILNFEAVALLVADLNGDGIDDLIVCSDQKAFFFVQNFDGSWVSVTLLDNNSHVKNWRNARVGDLTGDSILDLIVTKGGNGPGGFYIFKGTGPDSEPFFDLTTPFMDVSLPYATPDIELVDANNDGRWDIYVVQTDETAERDTYCAKTQQLFGPVTRWWGGQSGVDPPPLWVPPLDAAQDMLYVSKNDSHSFHEVVMTHAYPGCGQTVKKFGDNNTLALFQGGFVHPGYNLLLQW